MKWKLLPIIGLLSVAHISHAKELYVDRNNGNCSDSISYANNNNSNPWCTLGRAVWGNTRRNSANSGEAARAGDTVYIAAGTYDNSGGFNDRDPLYDAVNSGSPGNYITFQAVGRVELTTSGSTISPIIGSADSRYVKWDGFTINQVNINYRTGNGIVQVWGHHTTISNCEIIGIYTEYPMDDQHNAILALGVQDGADLEGLVIENNVLHGFSGNNGRNDSAITLYWLGSARIEHNEIYDNTTGIYAKSSNGDSTNVTIRYNLIRNNGGDGISVGPHSYWRVYQNIFQDNIIGFRFFPTQYQNNADKPKHIYLVNNTFVNNSSQIYWDYYDWINTCFVQNNIFSNTTYAVLGENVTPSTMSPSRIAFDYNIYNEYNRFGIYQSVNFSFAQWQGSTFGYQDSNSGNNVNPLFTDELDNDFSLRQDSPCREGRANDGVDILDLDNDGRTDDAITLGAYLTGDELIGRVDLGRPRNLRVR